MKKLMLVFALVGLIFTSCSKKNEVTENTPGTPGGTGTMQVYITDKPALDLDSVILNVVGVEVRGDDDIPVNLVVPGGFISLLDLNNGSKLLIGTGAITPRTIKEIRIILGDGNYVVSNGMRYNLKTPSAQESGLKVKLQHFVKAGVTGTVILDLDAGASIKRLGNGDYMLHPIIRPIVNGGTISGSSSPDYAFAYVEVAGAAGIFGTYTNSAGNFSIIGVPAGVYTVTIFPHAPFAEVVIANVVVVDGQVTAMGNIVP